MPIYKISDAGRKIELPDYEKENIAALCGMRKWIEDMANEADE